METRDHLIDFLRTIARPESDLGSLGDEEDLVETGVVDSLAVVELVVYLEIEHKLDVGVIDPTELVSIQGILNVISK
jgi:acyl carrier protein